VFPDAMNCSEDAEACDACKAVDGCPCGCYPGHRFYASAEYLGWWTKASRLPPLLTTSSAADPTAPGRTGALGLPNTRIVYGDSNVAGDFRSGVRLMAGGWLDDERCLGFEVGGFFLQTLHDRFRISSNGLPLLYRPFFDTVLGLPNVQFVAVTGIPAQVGTGTLAGTFSSSHDSSLWGAEANVRSCLLCGDDFFIDGIAGFRTLGLNESLTITENLTVVNNITDAAGAVVLLPAGTNTVLQDRFKTNNQFYGGQVGVLGEIRSGRWSLDMKAKLGLGSTSQVVDVAGFQVTRTAGAITGFLPNGLYASGTNIGRFTHNSFSVVPEVGLSVGYQVTEPDPRLRRLRLPLLDQRGSARLANQPVRQPVPHLRGLAFGPVNPTFPGFKTNDFWAQGIKVGVEFRY